MNKPLQNKTIVITRDKEQAARSVQIIKDFGANVIQFPTINITEPNSYDLFDEAIKKFSKFDYLIFTSTNSVTAFIKRTNELNFTTDYSNIIVIAAGKKTAKVCEENNIKVHLLPDKFSAQGVAELLGEKAKNKKILIPCSAIAREELNERLTKLGAVVTKTPIYNVTIPSDEENEQHIEELNKSNPDVFIFTSPSTFKNFIEIMKIDCPQKYFNDYVVAAIGTTTENAIIDFGVRVDIVPTEFTMDALVEEICKLL